MNKEDVAIHKVLWGLQGEKLTRTGLKDMGPFKDLKFKGMKSNLMIWDDVVERKDKGMSFMPVAPLHLLEQLFEVSPKLVGSSHLLLAHEVIAEPEAWSAFFTKLRSNLGTLDIIMDNSAVELESHAGVEATFKAALTVEANYYALPDVLKDKALTLLEATRALETLPQVTDPLWEATGRKSGRPMPMFILQGTRIEDFVECMEAVHGFPNKELITMIGIPRLAQDHMVDRLTLVKLCRAILPGRRIHLLGFSDNTVRDLVAQHEGCTIDSAVPLRAGQQNADFSWANADYGPRGDFFTSSEDLKFSTITNLKFVRSCMRDIHYGS